MAFFNRAKKPMVYEVRLEVDPALASEFDDWLLEHVREMLAFPGFQTATVYRGIALDESHRVTRLVVYEVRSRRELDSYLHTYAARMRKDGVDRFGKGLAASRRILPTADHSLPEGFAVLYDRQRISGGLPVCGNCHQPLPGRYCVHCGQEDRTFMLSLRELLYEFAGDMFNFDSRFFRTMAPLLFQPGFLTIEYLRGRRQRYLPPVRTYVFVSLLFFLFTAWLTDEQFAKAPDTGVPDTEITVDGRELSAEERAEVARALDETADALDLPEGTLRLPKADSKTASGSKDDTDSDAGADSEEEDNNDFEVDGLGGGDFEARLERSINELRDPDDAQAFIHELLQQLPTMMFVFLPLIALMLKVLYLGSGRYYVEHLIFTLHFHSGAFVLLLGWFLFGELAKLWAPLQEAAGWVAAAVWIYLPVYLYKSMRRVYGQGHFVTTLKYLLLLWAYLISLFATLIVTIVYTLYLHG